jgi:hypothetical protein
VLVRPVQHHRATNFQGPQCLVYSPIVYKSCLCFLAQVQLMRSRWPKTTIASVRLPLGRACLRPDESWLASRRLGDSVLGTSHLLHFSSGAAADGEATSPARGRAAVPIDERFTWYVKLGSSQDGRKNDRD